MKEGKKTKKGRIREGRKDEGRNDEGRKMKEGEGR